ncbi:MAG: hypothetical protein EHM35_20815 [Planctomycetaceae bacterium]|nr:MAG: hypothetical protein EHM35_20815 [Planctomycetaceae bacterium]
MRNTKMFSRAAAWVVAVILAAPLPAADIHNHSTWRDTQGNIIDCHEGGILRMGGTFYWYGRAYKGNIDGIYGAGGARFRCGFNCYSSTNLTSWTFGGAILTYPASGFLTAGTWHRPRVLYNAQTGKYVLWFFMFPTGTPRASTLVVATADAPTGPFTVQTGPNFGESGDLALLQDPEGQGYIAYDDQMRRSIRVSRLTPDFQKITTATTIALQAGGGKSYEGASLIRYRGKYIVAGSGVEGLKPTDTTYAVADSPLGPYTYKGLMSQQKTWRSQISSFFYLSESDQLIALCEQWLIGPDGKRVPAELSSQLWLPVTFDPDTGIAQMQHVEQWDPWAPATTTRPTGP